MTKTVQFLINGADNSKYNAKQWYRYLRKIVTDTGTKLDNSEIDDLLASDKLTMFQKLSLKQAIVADSPTHNHLMDLNKPAATPMLDTIKRKIDNA